VDKSPIPVDNVDNFGHLSTTFDSKIKTMRCYESKSSVFYLTSEFEFLIF